MTNKKPEKVRVNVDFTAAAYDDLKEIAADRGTTVSEVVRNALRLESWVNRTQKAGGQILVKEDGHVRELVRM